MYHHASAHLQASLYQDTSRARNCYKECGPNGSRTRVQTTLITRITCVSFLLHQLVSSSI
nr:MAG TPA: hypothetical protein [Bacteriophage sp.]